MVVRPDGDALRATTADQYRKGSAPRLLRFEQIVDERNRQDDRLRQLVSNWTGAGEDARGMEARGNAEVRRLLHHDDDSQPSHEEYFEAARLHFLCLPNKDLCNDGQRGGSCARALRVQPSSPSSPTIITLADRGLLMIASAWLGRTHSQRKARWVPRLERASWVLPFTVVAELRFGAEVAGWGARRRGVLERLIASGGLVPPIGSVTDAYVDLRTWCVRDGHGLGAKDHEADRWVAAVDIAGGFPLASEDTIFDNLPTLLRAEPNGSANS